MNADLVLLPGLGFAATVFDTLREALPGELTIHTSPIEQPAHYLGWSLGGLRALELAIDTPGRVQSLTTVATSPRLLADGEWPGVSADHWLPFEDFTANGLKLARRLLLRLQGDRSIQAHLLAEDDSEWESGVCALRDTDLRDRMHQLQVPTLALFGTEDALLPAPVVPAITRSVEQIQVRSLEGAPHAIPFTHPEELALIWKEFAIAPSR